MYKEQNGAGVPPDQYITLQSPDWTSYSTPEIDGGTWSFRVSGLVDNELTLDWQGFRNLPTTTVIAPFNCVTQRSWPMNIWEGGAFTEILDLIRPRTDARHVQVHCYGGRSTNLPLGVLMDEDVIFALKHDGEWLAPENGGPLRLVIPKQYAWTSAKWVRGVELISEDQLAFWEAPGYHVNGNPTK